MAMYDTELILNLKVKLKLLELRIGQLEQENVGLIRRAKNLEIREVALLKVLDETLGTLHNIKEDREVEDETT